MPGDQHSAPAPKGVVAYLTVSDAEKAIGFYKQAFGAVELTRKTLDGSDRIIHCALELNGGQIMLADDFPELQGGRKNDPRTVGGSPVTLHIQVENVDAAFVKAVEHGAEVQMPVADTAWGERYGKLRDPFGHIWSISTPIADLPDIEEV